MPNLTDVLNKAKPGVKPENQSAGWLVGALATVGLLLGAVGIGTGDIPRVLRNEPWLAGATILLVVAGSALGAGAGWMTDDPSKEKRKLALGALLFTLAAVAAVLTGIASASEQPEPGITVALTADRQGQRTLRFEVKDDGLRAKDKMRVVVQALAEGASHPVPLSLYGGSLGPNTSGEVDYSGVVTVPAAPANDIEIQAWVNQRHKCYEEGRTQEERAANTGCVTVHITRPFEKPQLRLAWRRPQHSKAGLKISLTDHDLGGHRVVLHVKDANTHHLLLAADWPPSAAGNVNKAIVMILPPNTHRVCVAASAIEERPNCSEKRLGTGTASILTIVPPS